MDPRRAPISAVVLFALVALAAAPAAVAATEPPVDQSDVSTANGYGISSSVLAADFVVTGSEEGLTSAVVWLSDADGLDDGTLDHFSGALSFAVYGDSSGQPGTLVARGNALNVVVEDTGLQASFGDILQVRFDFDQVVLLPAGTYWFALHENTWGSASDGSQVFWAISSVVSGAPAKSSAPVPSTWGDVGSGYDLPFALFGDPVAWDQHDLTTDGAWDISSSVTASDFSLTSTRSLSKAEILIWDEFGGSFSGEISWALYTNGTGKPGTLIAHGNDTAPRETVTGFTNGPFEINDLRLSVGPVTLPAGTYWLALHEGAWGAAGDGTPIGWAWVSHGDGSPAVVDGNETSPGTWNATNTPLHDTAFVLFQNQVFASGFEPDVTCLWSSAGGVCP